MPEYEVKALYLRSFIGYIDWPELEGASNLATVVIGVVNQNPFGDLLEKNMKGAHNYGRKIAVLLRSVETPQDALNCHILFFGDVRLVKTSKMLEAVSGRPIFTVMDSGGEMPHGMMLQFVNEPNGDSFKIRFDVNLREANEAGLKIGSQMLQSARNVIREISEKQAL